MIPGHKGEIPFVLLIAPFLAGIVCGLHFTGIIYTPFLLTSFLTLSSAFILLNIAYRAMQLYRRRWLGGVLINLVLFSAGWLVTNHYNELNHKDHFAAKPAQYLAVKISSEPTAKNGITRFTAVAEKSWYKGAQSPVSGTLLVSVRDSAALYLYYGDELLIPAAYNTVESPANPGEFNYKQYLANQNIYYQVFLQQGQFVILKKDAGNPIVAWSLRLRQRLVQKLKKQVHSPEAAGVASTLILGYKADLSSDVLQAYSKTGTIHVLSVSGAHVAIIFYLLNLMLLFMERFRHGKATKAILIIFLIWGYALLTGLSPAVCRAAMMISMVIIGKTYSRNINTLNILAISAFFLLLYNPFLVTDVGFQLSYLAVAGLIIFQPVIYRWFDFENKWADKLWLLCSASIAAQVITFPLSAYYFHQFPVYFLFSNLFIIIPSVVILYEGMAYLFLPAIPFVSAFLAGILEKTILITDKVLAVIEHAPLAGINKIWLSAADCWLLYGILILLFCFLYNRKTMFLKLSLGLVLLFSVTVSFKRWRNTHSDTITFLSLRKHTGIIFRSGNKALILTDLADTDKIFRYSVQPYLDSCQVSSVKICSPDSDVLSSFILKKNNLVQFGNKKVVLLNQSRGRMVLASKIKADCLYVSGRIDADFVNKNYDYRLIVLDGNYEKQSVINCDKYWDLKRNKSLTLVSN